jgi:hypothetical protein
MLYLQLLMAMLLGFTAARRGWAPLTPQKLQRARSMAMWALSIGLLTGGVLDTFSND